jgi:hypothetical protein
MSDNAKPTPGSPEYDAAMIARMEKGTGGTPSDVAETPQIPSMPEGGVEKFYDKKTGAYNWAAHVKELEFKLSQRKPDNKSTTEQKPDQSQDSQVKNVVESAGLKVEDLGRQIRETGKIADDSKAKLVQAGIPESLIDEYVQLANAHMERAASAAMEYIGNGSAEAGESEWTAMNEWASKNLSEAEKVRYNEMLAGPDWKVAIDTLRTKMRAASPTAREGSLITGTVTGPTITGYSSKRQMIADMQSDKYKNDPAFRLMVARKLAVSRFEADGID